MTMRRLSRTLAVAGACALAAGSACFSGEDGTADFSTVQPVLERSCAKCHDASRIDDTIAKVTALDDGKFGEAAFPAAWFPDEVRDKTVQDFIAAADPADDAKLDPKTTPRKAWILHELHELRVYLQENPGPDYTSQAKFDAFVKAGEGSSYEGCEMVTKLAEGDKGDPEGMAPLWGKTLLGLVDVPFTEVTNADRQTLRDYLNGVLPGGVAACPAQ